MIPRQIQTEFETQLTEYQIVTLVGPRQAGKTTLARTALPNYAYVNLEHPDTRQLATEDPRAFLKQYPTRTIFDEIQRAPHLLSYLQGIVDERKSYSGEPIEFSDGVSVRNYKEVADLFT